MDDLLLIKKYYGEDMMHLSRKLFPGILENKGVLFNILKQKFAYNKFLYDDIVKNNMIDDFCTLIYNFVEDNKEEIKTDKTPFELLSEAGYKLFECKNKEDINKYKKYYKEDELLCTFSDNRLKNYYVFFAVKNNVNDIKREDFKSPSREDLYGTSVISIQFKKGNKNILSIKNRYNHTVNNPDATFSNNLDNIIEGLSYSFKNYYNLNVIENDGLFELPGYVKMVDGKYYKYNYEINNTYYCPGNLILNKFEVYDKYQKEKERYIIFDYFILDLKDKKIEVFDDEIEDGFLKTVENVEKIDVIKNDNSKNIYLKIKDKIEPIIITIDKTNKIIEYINNNDKVIFDDFFAFNSSLKNIELRNAQYIADSFLSENKALKKLDLPNAIVIGNDFLCCCDNLLSFKANNLKSVGSGFLTRCKKLTKLNLKDLIKTGAYFLAFNEILDEYNFNNLIYADDEFLELNQGIINLNLPNVKYMGKCAFYRNNSIKDINCPILEKISNGCFKNNYVIEKINTPNLKEIGNLCFIDADYEIKDYIDKTLIKNNVKKLDT